MIFLTFVFAILSLAAVMTKGFTTSPRVLPSRKAKALGSAFKKNPFETDITHFSPRFETFHSRYAAEQTRRMEFEEYLNNRKYRADRDVKLYLRMIEIHDSTNDLQARAALAMMWNNHLKPAYLTYQKARGDEGAKGRYQHQLNLIEENVKVIEDGYQSNIELEQLQMIRHLEIVRDSLKPPAIDSNLDLSNKNTVTYAITETTSLPKGPGAASPKARTRR